MNHQLDTFHQELENNLIYQKSLPTSKNKTQQYNICFYVKQKGLLRPCILKWKKVQ